MPGVRRGDSPGLPGVGSRGKLGQGRRRRVVRVRIEIADETRRLEIIDPARQQRVFARNKRQAQARITRPARGHLSRAKRRPISSGLSSGRLCTASPQPSVDEIELPREREDRPSRSNGRTRSASRSGNAGSAAGSSRARRCRTRYVAAGSSNPRSTAIASPNAFAASFPARQVGG